MSHSGGHMRALLVDHQKVLVIVVIIVKIIFIAAVIIIWVCSETRLAKNSVLFASSHNFPCTLTAIKHEQPVFLSTHHLNMFGSSLSLSELYATAAVATFPFFFAVSSCPASTGCVVFAFLLQMCHDYVLFMFLLLLPPFFGRGRLNTGDCMLNAPSLAEF